MFKNLMGVITVDENGSDGIPANLTTDFTPN